MFVLLDIIPFAELVHDTALGGRFLNEPCLRIARQKCKFPAWLLKFG